MNVLSSISLSGMNAANTRLQTSAHNIANIETQNFSRQDVAQRTVAGGGTAAMVTQNGTGAELETDMVQQLQARNTYLANLSVFKTSNAVLGTLLNTSA